MWSRIIAVILTITPLASFYQISGDDFEHSGDYMPTPPPRTHFRAAMDGIRTNRFHTKDNNLRQDINQFILLVPVDEVKYTLVHFYRNDREVQAIYDLLMDKEHKIMRQRIMHNDYVKDVLHYFAGVGFDIKDLLNKMESLLDLEALKSTVQRNNGTTIGGLYSLLSEVLALLPQDEIFTMFFDKLDTSTQFSRLVDSIGSETFMIKWNALKRSKSLRRELKKFKDLNIDFDKLVELMQGYFFLGTF